MAALVPRYPAQPLPTEVELEQRKPQRRTLTHDERVRRERFIELVSQGVPPVKAVEACGWPRFSAHRVAKKLMQMPYVREQVVGNLQAGVVQMRALYARAKAVLFQNMDFDNPELKPSDRQAAAATVITALLKSGKPLSDAAAEEDRATVIARAVEMVLVEGPDGEHAAVRALLDEGGGRAGGGPVSGDVEVRGVPAEAEGVGPGDTAAQEGADAGAGEGGGSEAGAGAAGVGGGTEGVVSRGR